MCTVTYIPVGDKTYLTSNRDEKKWRETALPPALYAHNTGQILYPRDGQAGGTWMAVHENGNAIVLLNGGFENHHPTPPYLKSRGLVILELLQTSDPYQYFRSCNLENIEPFTIIILSAGSLFECRWNAERKFAKPLDKHIPHIWSSVTLYSPDIIRKRENWFRQWLNTQEEFNLDTILDFHRFYGDGDPYNDFLMNRDGEIFTVSIAAAEITSVSARMFYLDLISNQASVQAIRFSKEPVTGL
ncbi:MAG: hypothetical protein GC171_06765 [Terrimonas sp.]|nr:hypothetical protein [Terrimonas sp.]